MGSNSFLAVFTECPASVAGWISKFLLLSLFAAPAFAQVDMNRTCATCSRKKNDSLNLMVRKIRLNQVGYLPQDPNN